MSSYCEPVEAHKAECKGMDAPLYINALWMSACRHRSSKKQLVMFMRAGERFDRVFSDAWRFSNVDSRGRLHRTDANMPLEIRALKYSDLADDSPITPYGRFMCATVASGVRNRRLTPECIVSAPALRTVQSAAAVADVFGVDVQIDDELCEPQAWYAQPPNYLSYHQLVDCGLPILSPVSFDESSPPGADRNAKRLVDGFRGETEREGLTRIRRALLKYFEQPRDGPILIVGHAITLVIAMEIAQETQTKADERLQRAYNKNSADPLERKPPPEPPKVCQPPHPVVDHLTLGVRYPPACLLVAAQVNQPGEELLVYELPDLVPPLTVSPTLSNAIDLRL